ncbi:CopM family metallochaperone [Sphingomonas trueperi]|uniref:CopM family metallochaperone n=1 Tax=Sphingomonas trueperi TaxID=53317 RepID=UPI000EB2A734
MRFKLRIIAAAAVLSACSTQPQQTSSGNTSAQAVPAARHGDMGIPRTGYADIDFLRAMIPHHQGAIEMAQVELRHGTDPQVRALARRVIEAQAAEIRQMRSWLAARGVSPDAQMQGGH